MLLGQLKDRWKTALLLAAVFAAGLFGAHELWPTTRVEPQPIPASDVPPGEYLYLDSARVAAYLSQVEDGLSKSELRTLSHTSSFTVGATSSFVQAQGTAQTQNSLQETVTPTAGSLFFRLERKLRGEHWLRTLDASPANFARFRAGLGRLDEGEFVRIRHCHLVFPAFARIYPVFGAQAPALPLPFELTGETGERIDLLFPIAYSRLANEPTLFSTRLTVLGKVVREVGSGEPDYVDGITERAFRRALHQHSRALERLRLPPATLERQFRAAVTVHGPGVVVLPLAIFK